jgi:cytidyltransferase-like protein
MTFAQLVRKISRERKDKRVIVVGGTFDLLHEGHIEFLERSKRLGDLLVVIAASDLDVRKRKGKSRPIILQSGRLKMLESLKCVDYAAISHKSAYSTEILKILNPNIIVFALEGGKEPF